MAAHPKLSTHDLILKTLKEKSSVKTDIYQTTLATFDRLKHILKEKIEEIAADLAKIDNRITVEYHDRGQFDVEVKVAGDILVFHMHSNVFEFDKSHPLWKTSYVRENEANSFCGLINVYNFLADSFKYNRVNDLGYLIARIFVNREKHYFVEGKRQLGFLYNDFVGSQIDDKALKAIIESAILYCLDFDLLTPPYEAVKEITVMDIQELSQSNQMQTGKRLGFKFQKDDDEIIAKISSSNVGFKH
jgi:hypothetical protein